MLWNKSWFQYSILLLLAFIWGSSFILIKIGLISFTNNQAAAIRILFASLFLLPFSIKNLKTLKKKDLKSLLSAGFMGSFIPAFLFTKAQTEIDSSMAGMLNSVTPIFALVIGMIFFKRKTGWRQIVGLIMGLMGAIGLISFGEGVSFENINPYALLVVLATILYGININVIKFNLSHLNGIQITSLSFMFLLPFALGYLLTTDFAPVFKQNDWIIHFGALAILGIIGTALAMLLMNNLIRHTLPVFAASVTYIIPIFAIMWGLVAGETITPMHIICMAVIITGVWLVK